MSQVWEATTVDELLRLHKLGLSASRIAAKLKTTRNAVIGKRYRLGLASSSQDQRDAARAAASRERLLAKPRRTPAAPRVARGATRATRCIQGALELAALTARVDVEPDVARVSDIIDLEHHHCKYVVGEVGQGHGWCGDKIIDGTSYCATHLLRCCRPVENRVHEAGMRTRAVRPVFIPYRELVRS